MKSVGALDSRRINLRNTWWNMGKLALDRSWKWGCERYFDNDWSGVRQGGNIMKPFKDSCHFCWGVYFAHTASDRGFYNRWWGPNEQINQRGLKYEGESNYVVGESRWVNIDWEEKCALTKRSYQRRFLSFLWSKGRSEQSHARKSHSPSYKCKEIDKRLRRPLSFPEDERNSCKMQCKKINKSKSKVIGK